MHAALSASNSSWVNYDEEKMAEVFLTQMAAARGTRLHNLAHDLIKEGVRLGDSQTTLNMYVNDCIRWKMNPEQILMYSRNAFGTADAVSFRKNILRISDLKTGVTPAKPRQLEVYAALFCLEYAIRPFEMEAIELRIYQNDARDEYLANPVDIALIIDKIIAFDKLRERLREELDK